MDIGQAIIGYQELENAGSNVADMRIIGANFNKLATQWSLNNFNVDLVMDVADLGIIGANWSAD